LSTGVAGEPEKITLHRSHYLTTAPHALRLAALAAEGRWAADIDRTRRIELHCGGEGGHCSSVLLVNLIGSTATIEAIGACAIELVEAARRAGASVEAEVEP
jgi:hypothetical protein